MSMLLAMRLASHRQRALGAALASGSIVVLAACGASSEASDGAAAEVASLQSEDDGSSTDDEVDGEQSADEVALEFSQCLRDEGLDVADIGVDADGNVDIRSALENVEPGSEGFREAMDACREVLDGAGFGGGRRAIADNTEIADAMLEFSDCVRGEGFEDVADLTLGPPGDGDGDGAGDADGGAVGPGEGGPPEGGRGEPEGGFGDRSTLFAERMGLDSEDPDVVAAMDTCLPIIDDAFAEAGVGPASEE